jgi:ATP-binding cassette subfamily C protein
MHQDSDQARPTIQFSLAGSYAPLISAIFFNLLSVLLNITAVIYIIQIFERVLISRSLWTLVVISLFALVLFLVQGGLVAICVRLSDQIAGQLLDRYEALFMWEAALRVARGTKPRAAQAPVEDLQTLVRFIKRGTYLLVFGALWAPLLLVVLTVTAPWLGIFAAGALGALILVPLVRDFLAPSRTFSGEETEGTRYAWEAAWRHQAGTAAASLVGLSSSVAAARRRLRQDAPQKGDRNEDDDALIGTIKNIALTGIVGCGAWLVVTENATIGIMLGARILMSQLVAPFASIMKERRAFGKALEAWSRLRSLKIRQKPDQQTDQYFGAAFRADDVAVGGEPSDRPVCSGVKFQLNAGECLLVTGNSGTGKSLLLRSLAGLQLPASGAISLGALRLHSIQPEVRESLVGFLPQENIFLPGSLRDAIARYEPELEMNEITKAATRVGVHNRIMNLPELYETRLPPHGPSLAYGFGRLLSLARAIVGDPYILVLDEPLSGLAPDEAKVIREIVSDHRANGGIVVIASALPPFEEVADIVLTLREDKTEQVIIENQRSNKLSSLSEISTFVKKRN